LSQEKRSPKRRSISARTAGSKPVHPAKTRFPMVVTEGGMVMALQVIKALRPMTATVEGITIWVSFSQPRKVSSPMAVTPLGMLKEVMLVL
jgi:hypothetical protein